LSLRWEFVPGIEGTDRAVCWRWRAFTQAGVLFSESEQSFDTFTECVADAKRHGYERY
jgi:hypothetical protein